MGRSCGATAAASTSLGIAGTLVLRHSEVAFPCTPSAPLRLSSPGRPRPAPLRAMWQSPRGLRFLSQRSAACSPGTWWAVPEQKQPARFPARFPLGSQPGQSRSIRSSARSVHAAPVLAMPLPALCTGSAQPQDLPPASWLLQHAFALPSLVPAVLCVLPCSGDGVAGCDRV